MFTYQPRRQSGAWQINTAQVLIILIALGCAGVVYNAYQQSHAAPRALPVSPVVQDPRLAGYAAQMKLWQGKLAEQGLTLTWPYLGLEDAARLSLPKQQPITLAPWDTQSETAVAEKTYRRFVQVRRQSRVGSSAGCIVHVFDVNGSEVGIASASGVAPAQPE